MPTPTKYRLGLIAVEPPFDNYISFEFEAFPTASCTLAQHFASRAWYLLQERLEATPHPKEPAE